MTGYRHAGSLERELPKLVERPSGIGDAGRHRAVPYRNGIGAPLGNRIGGQQGFGAVGKVASQLGGRTEPGPLRPYFLSGKRRQGGIERNGSQQTMTAPFLLLRSDHSIGCNDWKSKPTRSSVDGVTLFTGAELGVQILRAAESENLLEEAEGAREEDQAFAIGCEQMGQAD